MTTIGNMTVDDLKRLIRELIAEERLREPWRMADDEFDERLFAEDEAELTDKRRLVEVFASIEKNRWTPPPGSPTVQQMLREDRDR